jgi:hypothetical protein
MIINLGMRPLSSASAAVEELHETHAALHETAPQTLFTKALLTGLSMPYRIE